MKVRLTVINGPLKGDHVEFRAADTFVIGRSSEADFQLNSVLDQHISRRHFVIDLCPPKCRIIDSGSRNGTHLNGEKIENAELRDGDEIRIGKTVLRFEILSDSLTTHRTSSWPPHAVSSFA